MQCIIFIFLLIMATHEAWCIDEEAPFLSNIRQVTFSEMGFERAGEAYFSPDGKKIAFQAVPIGKKHYQIYVMDLDEGIPRMVSTGRGACTCAFFHPTEEKMIFASSHEDPDEILDQACSKNRSQRYKWDLTPYMNIYEARLDGSELLPLTTGPAYHAECAYSPDGAKIVYASNEDGSMNLYTMNADGSDVKKITTTSGCYNGGPFFSPDGKQIVFRADRQKPDFLQIYVIDADGGNEKQITDNGAVNWSPFWHPNGEVIAYTTSLHGHYRYQIYLANILTNRHCRLTYSSTFEGLPTFNKEGTKLLWTSKRGLDNTCQVFIADFTLPEEVK